MIFFIIIMIFLSISNPFCTPGNTELCSKSILAQYKFMGMYIINVCIYSCTYIFIQMCLQKIFMNRRRPIQPINTLCSEMSMSYYYYLTTILSSSACNQFDRISVVYWSDATNFNANWITVNFLVIILCSRLAVKHIRLSNVFNNEWQILTLLRIHTCCWYKQIVLVYHCSRSF